MGTLAENIYALSKCSGAARKRTLIFSRTLDEVEEIKKFFEIVYDPFMTFNLRTVVKPEEVGTQILEETPYRAVLGQLHKCKSYKQNAEFVKDFAKILEPLSQEIFCKAAAGKLKIGMSVKSINKVFPGLLKDFGCMLASPFGAGYWTPDWLVSTKIDGVRAILIDGVLYSRNGKPYRNLDHIAKPLTEKYGATFDGELVVPGKDFQTSSGLIRSGKAGEDAFFYIFDVQNYSLTQEERYAYLDTTVANTLRYNVLKHHKFGTWEEVQTFYKKVLVAGYEGLVLKNPKGLYTNTRSKNWLKIKPIVEEDLPIIGFEEGEGAFANSLGALIVNFNGIKVRVGTGFSDDERKEFWKNQEEYIGRVIKVTGMEITKDKSIRHPVYKGLRYCK